MLQNREKFDMAGYHPGFAALNGGEKLQHSENKKVIGKMKDEHAETCQNIECKRCRGSTPLPHVIRAFCGLRAKMYACELVDEKTKMTAKGVKRSFVKNKLRFENYRQALFANTKADMQQQATFSAIRSFDHQVATVEITKTSLCPVDNKRHVLPDNVRTFAHGHFKIAASQ